jgi:hypothetical protein
MLRFSPQHVRIASTPMCIFLLVLGCTPTLAQRAKLSAAGIYEGLNHRISLGGVSWKLPARGK